MKKILFIAAGIVTAIVLVVGGVVVYAYQNSKIIEGVALYFLKQRVESYKEGVADSFEEKARFHAEQYKRRLAEAEFYKDDVFAQQQLLQKAHEELGHVSASISQHNQNLQRLNLDPLDQSFFETLEETQARYDRLIDRVYHENPLGDTYKDAVNAFDRRIQQLKQIPLSDE